MFLPRWNLGIRAQFFRFSVVSVSTLSTWGWALLATMNSPLSLPGYPSVEGAVQMTNGIPIESS